jgi:non-heme chloroperoxidase
MTDRPLQADPVELHFLDQGPRTDRGTVVFLHGWGMSLEVWDRQTLHLADRYRTVTVDLRGHGFSPKPATGYGYDEHVADVTTLLERLGVTDVTLVGWSMGGAVAARVAAGSSRIGRLILAGAPPRFGQSEDFPAGLPVESCRAFLRGLRVAREETMWNTVEQTFHQDLGRHVYDWLYQLSLRSPTLCALQCFEGVLAGDVRPDLRSLEIPVLVLHGIHDAFIGIEAGRWTAANTPNAELVEFADSGHGPFLEETERFNAALDGFLDV